jgi:hypothetical protein
VSVYAVLQPTVRLVVAQAEIARNLSTGVSDAIPRALEYADYACASDFWEDFLSEPREAEDFVHFISRFHLTPTHLDVQAVSMALQSFLKDAKRIKYPFILTPEDRAEKALIDPREAVRRLLSTPRRRSLIPVELAQHIESPVPEPSSQAAAPGDEASTGSVSRKAPTARSRGPRPRQLPRIVNEMRASDQLSRLHAMTEEEMAASFNASRDTCRRARNEVLSVSKD